PMRVAGIVLGSAVSAIIQIGNDHIQVTPGKTIPNGNMAFRVDSIEQDKVTLSRKWQEGDRKGVQHIEVSVAGLPGGSGMGTPAFNPAGAAAGPGGFPGGPGGMLRGGRGKSSVGE